MSLSFQEIQTILVEQCGQEAIVGVVENASPDCLQLAPESLLAIAQCLHSHEALYFDMLSCITGIDNGSKEDTMEVIYHLNSISYEHRLALKVILPRESPQITTLTSIWAAADWHEREAYDLFGIHFAQHPDLRRILLPGDWEGHPLRKDYQQQEKYHGMYVDYNQARDGE